MSQDHSRGGRGKEGRKDLLPRPTVCQGFISLSTYKWGQRSERFSIQPESHSRVITYQGPLTESSKVSVPVIPILQKRRLRHRETRPPGPEVTEFVSSCRAGIQPAVWPFPLSCA